MISKVIGTGTGLFNHSVRACLVLRSCDVASGLCAGYAGFGYVLRARSHENQETSGANDSFYYINNRELQTPV